MNYMRQMLIVFTEIDKTVNNVRIKTIYILVCRTVTCKIVYIN